MRRIKRTDKGGRRKVKSDFSEIIDKDLQFINSNLEQEFGFLSGKNLLITGGGGFLGYYLVQTALSWSKKQRKSDRISVTVYDNFIRGVPRWLLDLREDPRLTVVRHDMRKPLPKVMPDFQYIIHAAGIASPIYYRKHPIETMDANINGLRSLLDYSLKQKDRGTPIKGFLFFSSSEIYGDPTPENIPTPEDYRGNVSCTGPRACYDESKRYGETLCVNFSRQYNLPIKVARPFNNYGPGLKITDRRVIPDFARDIIANRDIVMLSDGSPRRTFCYVADAINGYYKILIRGKNGEAYNIGVEGPEISMATLAERLVEIARDAFGYKGKVVRQSSEEKDYLVDNPNRRCPLIRKAKVDLGYDPSISLEEGLKRSLTWYAGNREADDA